MVATSPSAHRIGAAGFRRLIHLLFPMPDFFYERRRTPRAPMTEPARVGLPVSSTARLLDISLTGALLVSVEPVDVGQRAELRTMLKSKPFVAQIEVRRVAPEPGEELQRRFRVGASFVFMDQSSREALAEFLGGTGVR